MACFLFQYLHDVHSTMSNVPMRFHADRVKGVKVQTLSPTSVNVSWVPIDSSDVTMYLVDYYQKAISGKVTRRRRQQPVGVTGREEFPGNASWGVVSRLQDGREYEFQVTAAVLLTGVLREGEKSIITVDSAVALMPAGKGHQTLGQEYHPPTPCTFHTN